MRPLLCALALLTLADTAGVPASAPRAGQPGVTVTFLANEGVMLAGGGRRVLIDALFLRYGDGFAMPHDSTGRQLHGARAPYDSVDLLLVTHRHGDHFHPAPVASHLRANPRASLIAPRAVVDSMRHHVTPAALVPPRYLARTMSPGTMRRETVNGVTLHTLGIRHTGGLRNRWVEHSAYIIEIGGRRVLHMGDAELSERTLAPLRLDTMRIDVALLPLWGVQDREVAELVQRLIRPAAVAAIHLGARPDPTTTRAIRAAMPGVVVFSRSLETRRW